MVRKASMEELLFRSLEEILTDNPNRTLDSISVKEIAANANTTSRTFYNHFKDKYELACWDYLTQKELWHDGIEVWQTFTSQCLEHMYSKKELYKKLVGYEGQNSLAEVIYQSNRKDFIRHIMMAEQVNTLDHKTLFDVDFYYIGTVRMGVRWIQEDMVIPINDFSVQVNNCAPISLLPYRVLN